MLPHVRHMQCLLTMSRCHFSGGRSLTGGGTSLGLEHAVPGPQPCLSDPTAIMPMGRKLSIASPFLGLLRCWGVV